MNFEHIFVVTDLNSVNLVQNNTIAIHSRRDFIRDMTLTGLGMMGLGAFFQSCTENNIPLATSLAKAYIEGILAIVEKIRERELPKISKVAMLAVQARLQGHKLYAYLSGGMLPSEIDHSRPGSPNIFITEDIDLASRGDVVLTNDPEIVRGFSERWVKVFGITTPSVPNSNTPSGALENMGRLRIEDVSDIVIFCHVPYTDGIVHVEGIDIPVCPASSVIHSLIYYAITAEIVEGLTKSGIYPRIG